MERNFIDLGDLESVLSELGDVNYSEEMMTEEMKASQLRCENYIEKHMIPYIGKKPITNLRTADIHLAP